MLQPLDIGGPAGTLLAEGVGAVGDRVALNADDQIEGIAVEPRIDQPVERGGIGQDRAGARDPRLPGRETPAGRLA